ncbi:MAG: MFS transporter [Clostridia bacterium]|nr:MFS transporter [Clostridia bacterium]
MLKYQYAGLQFGYWVDYLIIISFSTVVMQGRGFNPSAIGLVTTIGAILTIVLQMTIATIADRFSKLSLKTILLALFAGALMAAGLMTFLPGKYMVTFISMFVAISLTNVVNPLLVSLCLQYNDEGIPVDFGVARSIGSLGFAVAGYVMGRITGQFGTEVVLPIYCVLLSLLVLLVSFMPKPRRIVSKVKLQPEETSSLPQFFTRYPRYIVFLSGAILMFFMQMLINTYMIYFVREFGGGEAEMGTVLSLTAFAEIPAVALGVTLVKRFKPQTLLRVAAVAGFIKFASILGVHQIRWFIPIHAIHFFYSGLYTVSSVYFADRIVARTDAIKGQSLLSVGITGISGISANLIGGIMIEHFPIRMVLVLGACISLLGAVLMFYATGNHVFRGEKAGAIGGKIFYTDT